METQTTMAEIEEVFAPIDQQLPLFPGLEDEVFNFKADDGQDAGRCFSREDAHVHLEHLRTKEGVIWPITIEKRRRIGNILATSFTVHKENGQLVYR